MDHARSQPKLKRFPIEPPFAWSRSLMQSCAVILAINWVFQGMRGMDLKELGFRLLLEFSLITALVILWSLWFETKPLVWLAAAFLAHSVNFTLNGQVWVCARYCRGYGLAPADLEVYFDELVIQLGRLDWLDEAVCIGSRGAGSVRSDRADIDLRLITPGGFTAWLRTNLLLLRLRTNAFRQRMPLDLYAYDGTASLRRFDQDEPLLIILDRNRVIRERFRDRTLVEPP